MEMLNKKEWTRVDANSTTPFYLEKNFIIGLVISFSVIFSVLYLKFKQYF